MQVKLLFLLGMMTPTTSATISTIDAAQLLNGRGLTTLVTANGISLDTLLDTFPSCDNQCVGSTPCGSTSVLSFGSSMCVAPTKSSACPIGYVCCDPATCRAKTQRQCSYSTTHVLEDLDGLNYKSALQYLAYIGGGSAGDVAAVSAFIDKPLGVADNSLRCKSQCNGWNGVWTCPSSCDCIQSPVPTLVVGEKYRCVGTGFGASGYASPATKLANGTVVCPPGYGCDATVTSSTPCIGQLPIVTTTSAPAYVSPPLSSAKGGSGTDQTTAIAVGSACGTLGLVGAAAMYFMYRKKVKAQQEGDEHAASVLASATNDHYHEAPYGA